MTKNPNAKFVVKIGANKSELDKETNVQKLY